MRVCPQSVLRTDNYVSMPDDILAHPSVRRVREVLDSLGVSGQTVVLDEHVRTAALAAAAVGVTPAAIANSVVFKVEEADGRQRPLLVMTSGAHRCDTHRLAEVLAVAKVSKADPDFVRRHTGFVIGGVSPVGHPEPIQTLVDVTLASHLQIWAAAGHPRTVFPTHYDELLRITAGEPVEVN